MPGPSANPGADSETGGTQRGVSSRILAADARNFRAIHGFLIRACTDAHGIRRGGNQRDVPGFSILRRQFN